MRSFIGFLGRFLTDLYWIMYRPSHWANNVFGDGSDNRHLFDSQDKCKICNKLKEDCL